MHFTNILIIETFLTVASPHLTDGCVDGWLRYLLTFRKVLCTFLCSFFHFKMNIILGFVLIIDYRCAHPKRS